MKTTTQIFFFLFISFQLNAQFNIGGQIGYGYLSKFDSPGFLSKIGLQHESKSGWIFGFSGYSYLSESEGLFSNRGDNYYQLLDKERKMVLSTFWKIDNGNDGIIRYSAKPNRFSFSSGSLQIGKVLLQNDKHKVSTNFLFGIGYVNLAHIDYFIMFDHFDDEIGVLTTPAFFPIFRYQTFIDLDIGASFDYDLKLRNRLWLNSKASFNWLSSSNYSIIGIQMGLKIYIK